jgi:hypothetical protein
MPFAPSAASDVEVINSWSEGDITLAARRGTLASGAQRKPRYTIEVRSEPLLFDLNELSLGGKLAEVWAQRIRDNINGIAVRASDATIAMREKAAAAFQSGAGWARKRYAGGRIGAMAPNQSDKLFNDSGRTAAGVHVRQNLTDASYSVNLPANRFNREGFGAGYDAMVARFVSLVPMLDPKKAAGDPQIEAAIKESVNQMVTKLESNAEAAIARGLAKLRAERMRVLKQIGALVVRGLGL